MDDCEVYALVLKGTVDIQGMIAVMPDNDAKALYLAWAATAPQNNKQLTDNVKYLGVGGHLFSIAADKSFEKGFDGFMYGYAANEKLLKHYQGKLHADFIGMLHPYHFVIRSENARKIQEEYDYEWTDAKI